MTCRELFQSALRTVCEQESVNDVSDYEERAEYLLATFCNQFHTLDGLIRSFLGETSGKYLPSICLKQEEKFPLADRFVTAAVYYLSAMLVVDENEELSDRFFALYSDAISTLQSTLAGKSESISDHYGALI